MKDLSVYMASLSLCPFLLSMLLAILIEHSSKTTLLNRGQDLDSSKTCSHVTWLYSYLYLSTWVIPHNGPYHTFHTNLNKDATCLIYFHFPEDFRVLSPRNNPIVGEQACLSFIRKERKQEVNIWKQEKLLCSSIHSTYLVLF